MNYRTMEKDLYSILGVNPSASPEEIRASYLSRLKVIHPDRFDPTNQPDEWKKANEMLAELNEAYSILSKTIERREYDHFRRDGSQKNRPKSEEGQTKQETKSENRPPFEHGELSPGTVKYSDLPHQIQERMIARQKGREKEQFKIKINSIVRNYIFTPILLCWFWYLYSDASGPKWKDDTLLWYSGITLAVGLLIAQNITKIIHWHLSKLKSFFYITPIYFIKTEFNIISFRPLWTLKDINITHNYKNGSYQDSDVTLKFDGHNEYVSISSKDDVDKMFSQMKHYDSKLRSEYENNNLEYFRAHDDFYGVQRSASPPKGVLSKSKKIILYSLSLMVCGFSLLVLYSYNEQMYHKKWFSHKTPPSLPPKQSKTNIAKPSYPEKSLPSNGATQQFKKLKREAPFQIKAAQGDHYLFG